MRFTFRKLAKSLPVSFLLLLTGGALGFFLFGPNALLAQTSGTPPVITGISITQPTPTTTVVTWNTDVVSDSEVNFGLSKDYGIVRDPFPDKTRHSITVSDLEPAMVYHMRIGSADSLGNQALTGDYVVRTETIMSKKELAKIPVEERVYVERAIASIKQIKSASALQVVADAVNEQAKKELIAPSIIGYPRVDSYGTDFAVISWATDREAGSKVSYARETEYREGSDNPYTTQAGDEGERVKEHKVNLSGLVAGTTYHFSAESPAEAGLTGVSRDTTFTTKALQPTVTNFHIVKAETDSVTLAWNTNIPASGVVEYINTKNKFAQSAGSPIFATTHLVKISNLQLGARYTAVVKAQNSLGETVTSNQIYFSTVKDVSPPLISKVAEESTLYASADVKVQTIVSWQTDEKTYCQFFYREGLNPQVEPTGRGEEKDARTDHVEVITEFLPSTVYQFWVECRDISSNKAKSENFVLFTPNKEKSIIDIILENFQGTFGWVNNIGK